MTTANAGAAASTTASPKAKSTDIVVQELETEMLVYDLENDRAHHLNETVSFVWKNCDGKTTAKEIARRLEEMLRAEIGEDFVWLAFDELERANLFETKDSKNYPAMPSRRTVLLKYAPMAAALPVVMSLVAPPPAHAQSCIATGQPCIPAGVPCCTGLCGNMVEPGFCP